MSLGRSLTPCRYFMNGICCFGEFCRFSHDLCYSSTYNPASYSAHPEYPSKIEEDDDQVPSTSMYSRQKIWANAPVFVPSQMRHPNADAEVGADVAVGLERPGFSLDEICPYAGMCIFGERCTYPIHMELCEMCDVYCLHPNDKNQRREHNRQCLEYHEEAMELSFAVARSKDKTCGICFDIILEKKGGERRFGILSKCNHTFCLACIRTWRQTKQFEYKVTRGCPECRVCSDYVCPSTYWVDTKEDKEKLLNTYRTALGGKDCKYFRLGDGNCPFGNKCFYRHALPDGTHIDVGSPRRVRKPPGDSDDILDFLEHFPWRLDDRHIYNWLDQYSSDSISSDTSYESDDY
ncbi:probable E3 ubiquitin-protein ligase makorin-1 [Drosophila eugracilis]|uniref:probable E3 ubiquitin-protein ligase makorin-1 n=1 Tax=Drosophila eugracilis TaxID=29029 RepID=UPI0007E62C5D|nr:probable E3 ubiquitin-protein ligase makorin-1 [Drosophila eugracilis]